jgi:hypothetical protein
MGSTNAPMNPKKNNIIMIDVKGAFFPRGSTLYSPAVAEMMAETAPSSPP